MSENNMPYTHNEELNIIVTDIMNDWHHLLDKAKSYNMDIKFASNSENSLELYFHDDYPNMILVDKEISCKTNTGERMLLYI